MGKYKFLEHTSDVYVEVQAKNLNEAFEEAAKAVFDTMTDIKKISQIEKYDVKLEAENIEALLFDWIDKLIYIFDTRNLLFSKIIIRELKPINNKFELIGELWGEQFNPEKHESRTEIKAPTYSLMKIDISSKKVTLRFVLDI